MSTLILLVVLIVATLLIANRIARQEALRDAQSQAYNIGNLVAAPLVNARVRAHAAGAGKQLTDVMHNRMQDGSVTRVKMWDRTGMVIWSDEKKLVGRRFPLPADIMALFGTRNVTAEVSSLGKAENVLEQKDTQLLEVYAGTFDADAQPMVFEAYFSIDSMRHDQEAIFQNYLPAIVAALLLFQLAVMPLALSLARQVERGAAERSRLTRHALLASDLERRRIAQVLHDGVIQDLAGLSYALPALEAPFTDGPAAGMARETSRRVSQILARDVAALRSMITDLYPPDLAGPGLPAAIHDLASGAAEHGAQVEVDLSPDLVLPEYTARLAYRIVREGLRNVSKHSGASAATVQIRHESDRVLVSVSDNGRGLPEGPPAEGHLGLRLLEDTMRDLDGQLTLRSAPSGGAVLEASFPFRFI